QQPLDFALRKAAAFVTGNLVGRDAVFVEAAGLRLAVKHGDLVPANGQRVGAGQACRAGANHRDTATGVGRALEQLYVVLKHPVGGVALQCADLHRLALVGIAHTDAFAELLGRANPGAHAAEDVGTKYLLGCTAQVVAADAADETGD